MLEVKGRASAFWYWAAIGVVTSTLGWASWDWFRDGIVLRMLPLGLVVSGVVFFGFGIWKRLDKRPALVVDDKGLLDRTGLPQRLIAWNDIVQFRLVTLAGRAPTWLAIDLVDPDQLISSALYRTGPMLEVFKEKYGTPCVIALKALDIEPHRLLEQLKADLRQYKR